MTQAYQEFQACQHLRPVLVAQQVQELQSAPVVLADLGIRVFQAVLVYLHFQLDQEIQASLCLLLCLGFHSDLENLCFQLVHYHRVHQLDQRDQQDQLVLPDLVVQVVPLHPVVQDFHSSLESREVQLARSVQLVPAVPGHLCCQKIQPNQRHLWTNTQVNMVTNLN